MGDRANVFLLQESDAKGENKGLYFYTHWDGYKLPVVVQSALKKGQKRWDDPPYLARVIFCEMVSRKPSELTGYGISIYICDNDGHPILVIDSTKERVLFCKEEGFEAARNIADPIASWSFEEYCKLSEESLVEAWETRLVKK